MQVTFSSKAHLVVQQATFFLHFFPPLSKISGQPITSISTTSKLIQKNCTLHQLDTHSNEQYTGKINGSNTFTFTMDHSSISEGRNTGIVDANTSQEQASSNEDNDEIEITGSTFVRRPVAHNNSRQSILSFTSSPSNTNIRGTTATTTANVSTNTEPILIASDGEDDGENSINDDIVFESERQIPQEEVQITGERRTRPRLRMRWENGRAGYFLRLPTEQRYIPLTNASELGVFRRHQAFRRNRRGSNQLYGARGVRRGSRAGASAILRRLRTFLEFHPETSEEPALAGMLDALMPSSQAMNHTLAAMLPSENGERDDDIPIAIMEQISRSEQNEEDRRINSRNKVADRLKAQKEAESRIPQTLKNKFMRGILPGNTNICVLCGITLAEGIPENHHVLTDQEIIKRLVLNDGIRAPWQCCRKLTKIDYDLSKKIFFGKCGHVYCGRCVNNMLRAIRETKASKKKRRRKKINYDKVSVADLDFDDPDVCAPNRCVAPGCNKLLRGKYYFRELYI